MTDRTDPVEPAKPETTTLKRLASRVPGLRMRAELADARMRLQRRQARINKLQSRVQVQQKRIASHELALESLNTQLESQRDAPATDQADLRYIFIMTYGRSGSTLLQAILNTTPGVLVRGENGGIIYQLYKFHSSAEKDKKTRGTWADSPGFPYYGINRYPSELALERIRQLVADTLLRPTPDVHTVGIKEVRWYMGDLAEYVEFIRAVFPGARFIVNTRKVEDTAKSRWWTNHEDPEKAITEIEGRILDVAATLGDDAFHVKYDEFVADPATLEPMFDWLGLPFDLDRVTAAMETRYST